MMTSRERMLTALNNGRPDRLPCQVHGWMPSYLTRYLGGVDEWDAYARFGMDHAIYVSPRYVYAERDLARWQRNRRDLGVDADGNHRWQETIATPKGTLTHAGAWNEYTGWETEHLLDLVVESGADGLETMTPAAMGGDCDLREASRRVGDKLFFIGGFDQNAGFERGTPETARKLVRACFEATLDHAGYILCPSDHFFRGDPACLAAFADEARQCVYA